MLNRGEPLQDHLLRQIREMEIDTALERMCERIISALGSEDGGYLKVALRELLPPDADESQLELAEKALMLVQGLDPAGVAARDLKECLLLQLDDSLPYVNEMRTLITDHLEDLRDNRLPQIQKATGYTIEQIINAWHQLRKLNPKPASRFAKHNDL